MTEEKVVKLNIDLLLPNPYQPRKNFNENSLKELALSIREYGIINPILVRPKEDKYEIIAGERRIRAAKILKMTEVPAIVKNIDDEKMAEIALIENLQRENITPIEEAITYQEILKATNKTEKELSEMIGKSQPFIANKIRLLNLPKNIQDALINKKISERHARSLLTVKDENKQTEYLERIINEKLTVKELETIINEQDKNQNEDKKNDETILENSQKEEEKESDNMNNGNFFPNFNNTPDMNGNQASLNSMNNQTNSFTYQPEQPVGPTPPPMPTPSMPQPSPIPPLDNNVSPVPSQVNPVLNNEPAPGTNTPELPIAGPEIIPQMPMSDNNAGVPVAPEPPVIEEAAPVTDIPLFNSPDFNQTMETSVPSTPIEPTQPVAPLLTPEVQATQPEPQPEMQHLSMPEPPLFNQELAQQSVEVQPPVAPTEPAFDVPVATETTTDSVDKYTKLTELLNNNGIEYKAYSNETGYCVIIEL